MNRAAKRWAAAHRFARLSHGCLSGREAAVGRSRVINSAGQRGPAVTQGCNRQPADPPPIGPASTIGCDRRRTAPLQRRPTPLNARWIAMTLAHQTGLGPMPAAMVGLHRLGSASEPLFGRAG